MGRLTETNERLINDLRDGEQRFQAELLSESVEPRMLGSGCMKEQIGRAADEGGKTIAKVAEQLFGQCADIDAFGNGGFEFFKGRGGVAARDAVGEGRETGRVGSAQARVDVGDSDFLAAEGKKLLK